MHPHFVQRNTQLLNHFSQYYAIHVNVAINWCPRRFHSCYPSIVFRRIPMPGHAVWMFKFIEDRDRFKQWLEQSTQKRS